MELFDPNQQLSKKELQQIFVGKHLNELPTPMAVVDRRLVQAHCQKMVAACKALGVKFRPHIKTHKNVNLQIHANDPQTLEGTELQLGPSPKYVSLVVSTLSEAEFVQPLLQSYLASSTPINILYSMPFPPSAAPRLASISQSLGPRSLSLMIDHPSQLAALSAFSTLGAHAPLIFVKIGTTRAGLSPSDPDLAVLMDAALRAHEAGLCQIQGVYSHDSGSYAGSSPADGMSYLSSELTSLRTAAELLISRPNARALLGDRKLLLSAGATPDATSAQNLVLGPLKTSSGPEAKRLRELLQRTDYSEVELHAGVYPFLDMQQIRTKAVPAPVLGVPRNTGDVAGIADESQNDGIADAGEIKVEGTLDSKDVAFTVMAEICSVYPARSPPQALINAGCLALGREPCIGYTGMGIVSNWKPSDPASEGVETEPLGRSGWAVGKVAQEHGVLWSERDAGVEGGKSSSELDVNVWEVGRRVRVLPNHACIAGAGFAFYVVVDGGDTVVDVWVRCRGW